MLTDLPNIHQDIVEQLDYFISTVNTDFRLLTLNPFGRKLCGIAAELNLMQHPLYVHHFHDKENYHYLLNTVFPHVQKHSYWQGPLCFFDQQKNCIPTQLKVLAHRDLAGNIISYTGIAHSLPSLPEQTLDELNKQIFDDAIEGIMVTDAQARILKVNPAFTSITGYKAAEVIGKTPAILRSSHHGPDFYRQMWQTIEKKGYWQGEIWNRKKDLTVYQQWLKISRVQSSDGALSHYLAVFQDLSVIRSKDQQIHQLVNFDRLTRLGNRELLVSRFPQTLAQCKQQKSKLLICWIDGGQLSDVNQQLGLTYGDRLIQLQAERLQHLAGPEDTLVRIYADDYILLHQTSTNLSQSNKLISRLLEELKQPARLGDEILLPTPHIGVACYPEDGEQEEDLLHAAELAMFAAKEKGGPCLNFYNRQAGADYHRKALIRQKLLTALQADEVHLQLYFQPKVKLSNGSLAGAEALIRWQDPELGAISPADFIPIAEQSSLIIELDRWVVKQLCRQLVSWQQQHLSVPVISFNISARHLVEPDFTSWLLACLQEYQISASALEMEITETALIDNEANAISKLQLLKDNGMKIALDDFGTGYSSLCYLKNMPLDTVKIDRSVVSDLTTNAKALCIIKSIQLLASELQLGLAVEGIENQQQHQILVEIGCPQAQGYWYARPMPANQMALQLSGSL
ncbi:putative bifunctional diguanylate cyclase/phosphodiesterase [Alkalimonas amylolytica]|uniref:PAS domain S-box-containing protein/diguanylate cyclase (GGDEF) domain-containing protein n=1 Tax=Alkalimonas amylolytica TaxID=152573 RepID=A0A1H3XXT2_ALKAM|nr:GGDEF domain-containing phosphodiesterase [Alkalimonas amylolytica]SEA03342.1 PAS domain S-box-containing protein/diguanylate cyclase (GGDEF) domain-containing protein [Alkalimonas amylolytica]